MVVSLTIVHVEMVKHLTTGGMNLCPLPKKLLGLGKLQMANLARVESHGQRTHRDILQFWLVDHFRSSRLFQVKVMTFGNLV